MVFLLDSTDSKYPRRAVGPVVENLWRGTESRSYGRSALVLVRPLRPPRKLAITNTQVSCTAPDVFTLSDYINPGLLSQDENVGASIYGDRRVPTLGRMMVATEV